MVTMVGRPPSMPQVRSLFRLLLRTASRFPDYNIREYVKRRTAEGFKQNQLRLVLTFIDGKSQPEWNGIRGLSGMVTNVTLDQQSAVPIAVLTFYKLFEIRCILVIPSRPRVQAFYNQFLYFIRKTRFRSILALIPR